MAWDDDKKAQVVSMYEGASPTPETSMEIVKEIAEEVEESPNGVRMILTKAGVYIKKATTSGSSSNKGEATKRVSKVAAHAKLTDALTSAGQEVDADIIDKLSGKAAMYIAGIIENINQ
jgi:ribosome recycling factor